MSGGGGIISGLIGAVGSLFGNNDSYDTPAVEVAAVPAPSRKQDTGAIVRTGADAAERVKNKRVSGSSSSKTSISSLGSLGAGSGLRI